MEDLFIASFSGTGEHRWTRVYQGPGGDVASSIAMDGRGNVLAGGWFTGSMSVAPRGTLSPAAGDACDAVFLLLGEEDGFVVNAGHLAGPGCETASYAAVDTYGGLLILGGFTGEITLLSGTADTTSGPDNLDIFFTRVADF